MDRTNRLSGQEDALPPVPAHRGEPASLSGGMRPLCAPLLLAALACANDDAARREAERAVEVTLPAGAVQPVMTFARNSSGISANWHFEITVGWTEYSQWVADRLRGRFICQVAVDRPVVECTRELDADLYTLTLTASTPAGGVTGRLRGSPR